jgi:hypothetical protein
MYPLHVWAWKANPHGVFVDSGPVHLAFVTRAPPIAEPNASSEIEWWLGQCHGARCLAVRRCAPRLRWEESKCGLESALSFS